MYMSQKMKAPHPSECKEPLPSDSATYPRTIQLQYTPTEYFNTVKIVDLIQAIEIQQMIEIFF
jgi:hypothetical protein